VNFSGFLSQVYSCYKRNALCLLGLDYKFAHNLFNFDINLSLDAEAVQRAAAVAEAEGANQIEPTHLEIILPQLLLDF